MRATSTVRAVGPAARRARARGARVGDVTRHRLLRAHLTGAAGALLAVVSVLLAGHGRVLLHGCVAADGPLAALGVRAAVLRSAVECPEGTLGLGAASHGAVLLLSVAVPVVAVHLLLAACGLGLGVVLRRAGAVLRALAARLVAGPRTPAPRVPTGRAVVPALVPVHVRAGRGHDPARPRRGPPVR